MSWTPLAGKLTNSIPPIHVATMMDKLKTLDCTEVAMSRASSTCLVTAVWYIVTSGPKARPQRKNAA